MSYERQTIYEGVNNFLHGDQPAKEITPVVESQPIGTQIGTIQSGAETYALMRDQYGNEYASPLTAQQDEPKKTEIHIRKEGDHHTIAAEGNIDDIRALLLNPLVGPPAAGQPTVQNRERHQFNRESMRSLHMPGGTVARAIASLALIGASASLVYGVETSVLGNQGWFMDFRHPTHLMDDPIHDAKRLGKLVSMVAPW